MHLLGYLLPNVGSALIAAGSANGSMTISQCLREGAKAGAVAAEETGFKGKAGTSAAGTG